MGFNLYRILEEIKRNLSKEFNLDYLDISLRDNADYVDVAVKNIEIKEKLQGNLTPILEKIMLSLKDNGYKYEHSTFVNPVPVSSGQVSPNETTIDSYRLKKVQ